MPSPNRQINGQLAETQKPPGDTSKYYIHIILQVMGTRLNVKIAGSTASHRMKMAGNNESGKFRQKKTYASA
ncbi:hypothetical protein RC91_07610 [Pectobacterium brasiliense]|nr:hypothetical protein RC92_14740 [Pectobacterium brasiliense]KHT05229.1 hypothetical protein RC91_07610 [Pectobacterium brasiliense]